MSFFDGFVLAVPTADKDKFLDHCNVMDSWFVELGALRVVECWGADVPDGKVTDFRRAVQAKDDETVCFSWIEWPDKATRDAAFAKMMDPDNPDPRTDAEKNPMPFDGKRMLFGGFDPLVVHGQHSTGDYVQGFMIPVPEDKKNAYAKIADEAWDMFKGYGATSVAETWGSDVPAGKLTDFYRGVNAEPGEKVVFSYMTWPSREVCDAASQKMQEDMEMPDDMPFDPKRMVWGGFEPIVDLKP